MDEIDAIEDTDERAAKLARELLGDYGNISKSGEWIRKSLIPFYAWCEINAPRYVYLIRNSKYESREESSLGKRMVALGGKKAVMAAGKLALRASMLYGAVIIWNMLFFPDEEEELGESGRRQLHIILGRREDGSIISLRFQGALSDALSWFGLEDLPKDVQDVATGKNTILEKLMDAPKAFANRLVLGLRPEPKLLYEGLTGKTLYPEFDRPRPIRDTWEHILRTFKLDSFYRYAVGKPGRGSNVAEHFINDLKSILVYESDPGEQAYYDTRNMVYDWLEKHGAEKGYGEPTDKSNALYYYRQAMKYGDMKRAAKYLEKYYELGGTPKGLKQSILRVHPLAALAKQERPAFYRQLTPEQKEVIKRAEAWYLDTFVRSRPRKAA